MIDPFKGRETITSTAKRFAAVTPNDNADLPVRPRALFVGGEGDLAVTDEAGGVVVLKNATGFLPIGPNRVRATGTTATHIVAVW